MRATRVDATQAEIVAGLRRVGVLVLDLHAVGHSAPDLLVGYRGRLVLLEVKSPGGRVRPGQLAWHRDWGGYVVVVRTLEEAYQAVGVAVA